MNKQLLSLAAIALSISVNSQISVTSANIISIGDVIIQKGDTVTTVVPKASSATAQTWDFSTLVQHNVDTITAVDPSTTLDGASFPTANIALKGARIKMKGYSFIGTVYANNNSSSLEIAYNNKLSVYPNPTHDLINFKFEGEVNSIEIIDITGKKVLDVNTRNRNSIDVSNLDKGTYILSVKSNKSIYTSKFIKK